MKGIMAAQNAFQVSETQAREYSWKEQSPTRWEFLFQIKLAERIIGLVARPVVGSVVSGSYYFVGQVVTVASVSQLKKCLGLFVTNHGSVLSVPSHLRNC